MNIGIYGTGLAGKAVFESLDRMNIPVAFFLDGDSNKVGLTFCNREIVDLNKIPKNCDILIAANPKYGIHHRLESANIKSWRYVDPEFLRLLSKGYTEQKINSILQDSTDKIHRVYDELADERSKLVFESILRHRKEHNLALLNNICDENQYFGNDIIGLPEKNFVDCGAFTGDTLKRFLNKTTGGYHYYAFEADEKNSDAIVTFCKNNKIKDVDIFNIAVCEKKQTLHFAKDLNDEKVAGKITDYGDERSICVQGDSLDNILGEKKIDMITMDIEGAEINALQGACNIIRNQHPKLAISAYHDIKHLWEIPILIHEISPEYHIYYRHHRWNMDDTVCYAIYEDKE